MRNTSIVVVVPIQAQRAANLLVKPQAKHDNKRGGLVGLSIYAMSVLFVRIAADWSEVCETD